MNQEEPSIREAVKKRLAPFMRDFDTENRGNRISHALSEGLGRLLENLIVSIIKEQNKEASSGKSD